MEFSTCPMMLGVFSIPRLSAPVVITTPIPPMAMEFTIAYPVVSWGQTEDIIRGYNHDRSGNKVFINSYPRSSIMGSPIPVAFVEAIPEASEKIETYRARHQIDIALLTGNYHNVRGRWKFQRRGRGDVNVDVNFCSRTERHAYNQKQGNDKNYAPLHKRGPPFG
jgi:hypothetical protein